MHELSVVSSMLTIIDEQVKKHDLEDITKIKVVIGDLAGIVPDAFSFCWEVSTKDTPYEKAVLEIEKKPAVAICNKCLKEFNLLQTYICPHCGEGSVKEIISGKELYIDSIEGD